MVRYSPEDWNINGAIYNNDDDKLVNRTDNPLERFNRTLNNFFPNGHPAQFVEVLKDICNTTLEKLKLIQRGRDTAPEHTPPTIYGIPEEYNLFIPM